LARLYVKLTLPYTSLFLALALFARLLGSLQPLNPVLEGFTVGCEDKPQPCWYGIVPRVTTVEYARTILENMHYQVAYSQSGSTSHLQATNHLNDCLILGDGTNNTLIHLSVSHCYEWHLGHYMIHFGLPQTQFACIYANSSRPRLYYQYDNRAIILNVSDKSSRIPFDNLSAYNIIRDFVLVDTGGVLDESYTWRGFSPKWHYCLFDPA
jgi:hypothetical protein